MAEPTLSPSWQWCFSQGKFKGLFMKYPIFRTVPASVSIPQGHVLTPVEVHAIDFGGDTNAVSVSMPRQSGGAFLFSGTLSGVTFHTQEKRGAPKKFDRDVALFLAFGLLRCGGKFSDAKARQKVLEMWSNNNWQGVPDESALNKKMLAVRAKAKSKKYTEFFYDCYETEKSIALLAHHNAFDMKQFQHARGEGKGWVWRYGTEKATYGSFRFDAQLDAAPQS